jgi:hypothetical protein
MLVVPEKATVLPKLGRARMKDKKHASHTIACLSKLSLYSWHLTGSDGGLSFDIHLVEKLRTGKCSIATKCILSNMIEEQHVKFRERTYHHPVKGQSKACI